MELPSRSNYPAAFETTPKSNAKCQRVKEQRSSRQSEPILSTSFQASLLSVPSFFPQKPQPQNHWELCEFRWNKESWWCEAAPWRPFLYETLALKNQRSSLRFPCQHMKETTTSTPSDLPPPGTTLGLQLPSLLLALERFTMQSHLVGWARNGGVICKVSCLTKNRINEQMKWDMWHLPKSYLHDLSSLMATILFAYNWQISIMSVQAALLALLSLHCLSLLHAGHIIATFLLQEEHCFSLFCDQTIGMGKEGLVNTITRHN